MEENLVLNLRSLKIQLEELVLRMSLGIKKKIKAHSKTPQQVKQPQSNSLRLKSCPEVTRLV